MKLRFSLLALSLLAACERPTSGGAGPSPAEPSSVVAVASAPPPPGPKAAVVAFDDEPLGGPSQAFEGVVGDWYVTDVAGTHGLIVDGGKWRDGVASVSLADQAKRLYGDRYAEFLD